jgi:alkylated DNA repair dioxygenase AlkB
MTAVSSAGLTPLAGCLQRRALDAGSWVDLARGWLPDPDGLYADLAGSLDWRQGRVWLYDHYREENRLAAGCSPAAHPVVLAVHKALRRHYGVDFMGVGLSWYRDGRDAMGAHRDTDLRHCEETLIAILTLAARGPWRLTPRSTPRTPGRRPAADLAPAAGDLLVMGGRAQVDWLHGVPPAPAVREGRISLQWRWTSGRGRPERGGGSRAPRRFGSGR